MVAKSNIQKLIILGSGESGTGAALLAKSKGFEVFVSDFGAIRADYKKELTEAGITFEEGKHSEDVILSAQEVIKSPGISEKVEVVKKIQAAGIPIIDELEFASRYTEAKIIAITGTNGKTTTTLLTYHLLKEAGFKVGLAGNVGFSMAKQVIENNFDYFVLEVSSFQLDGMNNFKADVAVLLNITPDHLDRYDYKIQNYIESKFSILRNMDQAGSFIYYKESELLKNELKNREVVPQSWPISLKKSVKEGAYFEEDQLVIKINKPSPKELKIPVSEISIQGKHNNINSMAAIMAALAVGVSEEFIKKGLLNFKNAAHRMEPVGQLEGVKFINDSKATNVDSVYYALDAIQEPIVWIAGGTDKGNDYKQIEKLVKNKVKALVCLGKDNEKLMKYFRNKVSEIRETQSVNEAVELSFNLASKGDVVMLSPACASFDLFRNYEDRGDQFRRAVAQLIDSKK